MKRFFLLAVVVLSGATAVRAAPQVVDLMSYQGKQFTVDAEVAGARRSFLFDTGGGVTMISPKLAAALRCEPWGNVVAFRMLGERLDLPRCDAVDFRIGDTAYIAPTTIVYDLAEISKDTLPGPDGAIGLDLFAGRTVTLQFSAHRVVIEDETSARRRAAHGIEIPMRMSRPAEGAALDVNIGVETTRGLAWMELDSANAGPTIFVAQAIAPLLGLDSSIRTPQPVKVTITPGVVFEGRARVFPGMVMDGNIGMQFMTAWDITLDLKAGRAWVAKPANLP